MKIAIWGKKKEAIYLMKQIRKKEIDKIICFVDNNIDEYHTDIEGVPLCSFCQFKDKYKEDTDAIILALRNEYSIGCILRQLDKIDGKRIGLMKPSAYDFGKKINLTGEYDSQIMWLDNKKDKGFFPYFQVILINTCNLNCKGCTHFASLFNKTQENNIYPISDYIQDVNKISQYANVFRLRLMGGEPLLYPYLEDAIKFARCNFPDSDIRIVTNGLLFLKASTKLLENIKKYNIGIDISPYKPTVEIKHKIVSKLDEYNIDYCFEGFEDDYVRFFSKNINIDGRSDKVRAMQKCFSVQCQTLSNGKIYKCPFEALGYKFFNYFQIDNYMGECGYNIRENNFDWSKMIEDLKNEPVEACKYCSDNTVENFEWKIEKNPSVTDWIINSSC